MSRNGPSTEYRSGKRGRTRTSGRWYRSGSMFPVGSHHDSHTFALLTVALRCVGSPSCRSPPSSGGNRPSYRCRQRFQLPVNFDISNPCIHDLISHVLPRQPVESPRKNFDDHQIDRTGDVLRWATAYDRGAPPTRRDGPADLPWKYRNMARHHRQEHADGREIRPVYGWIWQGTQLHPRGLRNGGL